MTDEPTDTADERTESGDDESSPADGTEPTDADGRTATFYLEWGAFAVLTLLALVATYRFYLTASRAIEIWFSADYVPVLQAVFNLLVLVVALIGLSVLVRRMRGERILGAS